MSPAEVARTLRLRLSAELREDLSAIERRGESVVALGRATSSEPAEVARLRALALAFELERFYTAVESTLERAILGLDGQLPKGERWHAELLRAAAVALPDLRPALLSKASAGALRDLLAFRHFARHAYDVEPEPARLAELAIQVETLVPELRRGLEELFEQLERP